MQKKSEGSVDDNCCINILTFYTIPYDSFEKKKTSLTNKTKHTLKSEICPKCPEQKDFFWTKYKTTYNILNEMQQEINFASNKQCIKTKEFLSNKAFFGDENIQLKSNMTIWQYDSKTNFDLNKKNLIKKYVHHYKSILAKSLNNYVFANRNTMVN